MKTSLKELALWHRSLLDKPNFDPGFTPYYSNVLPGGWNITRYTDVQEVLADHKRFSSEYIPKVGDNIYTRQLNAMDPPQHTRLRNFSSLVFSASVVQRLEGWIREQCIEILSPFISKGEMDFVNDFAIQLPHRVISRLVGVADHDADQVRKWIIAVAGDPNVTGIEIFAKSMQEMAIYFGELVQERQHRPQDDLMSHLISAEIKGEKLSMDDVAAMCVAIFLGGYETTKSSLSNAMFAFCEYPSIQQQLAANPGDIPKAVSEALRLVCPVIGFPRIATEDTEVSGSQIKKGDLLNVMISSANRDEAVFVRPDEFDPTRGNLNQSMAFGHGIHACLGIPLAKLETKIAFETIFSNIGNLALKDPGKISLDKSNLVYSLSMLPVTFLTI
ncbi:cytochrome P450 [Chitinophaga sp. Ak27]|uniref:cytochrome P450 n=1 Tax=Chitinophaga sp. Ak27 TaxID=2726116 RepID=UPI00145C4361|nr:cytochrome P450 [Chitinophaga sp. Ak27]NLU94907.1 cytochrome P450 [Chitinophaga sp. Ak27]